MLRDGRHFGQREDLRALDFGRALDRTESIQKEVDDCTRRLEQDKKKLFRAQENQREILQHYHRQTASVEAMMTRKYETETTHLTGKLKYLQGSLQKSTSDYNQVLARNNALRHEINDLRKDRKSQMEAERRLKCRIEQVNTSIRLKEEDMGTKRARLSRNKQEILHMKGNNDKEHQDLELEIDRLAKGIEKMEQNKKGMKGGMKASETSNSQPLVLNRLKKMLLRNRQRFEICDSYKKSLQNVQHNFEEMSEHSRVRPLEQIKDMFLKQDEQSILITEMIGQLSNHLDNIREENSQVRGKIQQQKQCNQGYSMALSHALGQKAQTKQMCEFMARKQRPIAVLREFLTQVSQSVFEALGRPAEEEPLNFLNYEQYLCELEQIIDNRSVVGGGEADLHLKENSTRYSRGIPNISFEELRNRNEEGLLQQQRLREFASEFWCKKKQLKN